MKLNVAVLNPAGNITLLVTTPVDRSRYAEIAGKLLKMPALRGEQVGFLAQPRYGGRVRLEMMGGEFCGNALRCVGYYYAVKEGIHGRAVILSEISGSNRPLPVEIDTDKSTAKAEMPLPLSVRNIMVGGRAVKAVVFEGVVHFIVDLPEPDEAFIKEAVSYALDSFGSDAAGVMFFDRDTMFIRPAVYVHDTETLIYENSCASGSAAVSIACAFDRTDGEYCFDIHQPGGTIQVELSKQVGCFKKLTIGGKVSLDQEAVIHLQ